MAGASRLDVALALVGPPGECVAGVAGQLAEERSVSTPVPLPERMCRVQLGVVVGQAVNERPAGEPSEVFLAGGLGEDSGEMRVDVLARANTLPSFAIATVRSSPAHSYMSAKIRR